MCLSLEHIHNLQASNPDVGTSPPLKSQDWSPEAPYTSGNVAVYTDLVLCTLC